MLYVPSLKFAFMAASTAKKVASRQYCFVFFFFSFNFMGLFQTAVFEANYIVYFMFSLLRRHNHKKHMIKMVEALPPLQFSRLKTCIFSLFVEGKLFKALKWMSNLSVDLILTNICFLCVSHYLNLCF